MPNYVTAARNNSIIDQLSHRMAQGNYNGGGGVSNSARTHLTASKPLQVLQE